MRKSIYIAAFAAALSLVSCKSTTASLSDKQYTLTELNGTQLEKVDVTPSISFAKGRVNATVGCNQIFADYKVSKDGKITFSTEGMTRMLCPDVMREDEFVEAFNKVDRYQISADGSEVSFLDKAGKVLFKGKKRNSRAPSHGSTTNFFHTQIFHPKIIKYPIPPQSVL